MKVIKVDGKDLKLRLSPSFIERANCPLALRMHYVDKVGEKYVRIAAERGKAVHAAIADLIKLCRDGDIQPKQLGLTDLQDALQKHTPPEIMSEVSLMLSWLKLWAERYKISPNIHGYEEALALDEDFDECEWDKASYRGILDVIETKGNYCVIEDWKSQPHIMSQTELDEHEQLTMYCWLVWKLYPHLTRFRARIWYLRYGFYDETERTEADLVEFEHALMIKERKISEINNWEPRPGKHCQYCDYIHMCPLANDLSIENTEVISQEQAVQAAKRVTVMEQLTKELKGKLKEYVKAHDDVRTGDGWVYGFNHRKSVKYDPKEVAEVLEEYGFEFPSVVNVDARAMKKLLKEASKEMPDLEMAIEEIQKEKHTTTFEGFKPKE